MRTMHLLFWSNGNGLMRLDFEGVTMPNIGKELLFFMNLLSNLPSLQIHPFLIPFISSQTILIIISIPFKIKLKHLPFCEQSIL
jgi:hypothetical protein